MSRENPSRRIQQLAESSRPYRVHLGRLAENYDGIAQYVRVVLSQGSSSVGYKARVAAGDFGTGTFHPAGTPVTVRSIHGKMEVLSLGTKVSMWSLTQIAEAGAGILPDCDDIVDEDVAWQVTPNGDIETGTTANWASTRTLSVTSSNPHSGTYRLSLIATLNDVYTWYYFGFEHLFRANTMYYFEVWVNTTTFVNLYIKQASGLSGTVFAQKNYADDDITDGVWTRLYLCWTPAVDTNDIYFTIKSGDHDLPGIDDLRYGVVGTLAVTPQPTDPFPHEHDPAGHNSLLGLEGDDHFQYPLMITTDGAPTVDDDSASGWRIPSLWHDTTDDSLYSLTDPTVGAAIWSSVGGGGGGGGGGTGLLGAQSYLGKNAIGAAFEILPHRGQRFKPFTLTEPAIVLAVEAYWSQSISGVTGPNAGIWSDEAGRVGNLMAYSNATAPHAAIGPTDPRWLARPIGLYLPAGDYWMGVQSIEDSSVNGQLAYDTGGSDRSYTASGNWLHDPQTGDIDSTRDYSIRVSILTLAQLRETLLFVIDGHGAAIATGIKGDIVVDYAAVIEAVTLLADSRAIS